MTALTTAAMGSAIDTARKILFTLAGTERTQTVSSPTSHWFYTTGNALAWGGFD
ncbi:hypothetical protein [Stenotrophomonas sp. PD6]|uniref:hypothetical protein n=1 Tax=Stenotrophomonas sp. PD6 TaxID=3368612 RepID=UPI003BA114E1